MSSLKPDPFSLHDHTHCADETMRRVDKIVAEKAVRLTPVRRRVLEILLEEHRAFGAYEVLERLGAEGFGKQPPVVYRALEFLVEHGLAHRVRRLNAFIACMQPGHTYSPVFFICSQCQSVAERPGEVMRNTMDVMAKELCFDVERTNIEAVGICPTCQGDNS